jgi:hypothetical protein
LIRRMLSDRRSLVSVSTNIGHPSVRRVIASLADLDISVITI